MEYFDERSKTKYVPHVIEPSVGVDRLFLAVMVSAYHEDEVCALHSRMRVNNKSMRFDKFWYVVLLS